MNTSISPENISAEALLAQITDEFLERLNAGELPDTEDYAQRYPHLAEVLRQVLPALCVLRQSPSADMPADGLISGVLGDFRILREVGRGGMGIVYEAEQISLGRRVALKVLPLAATLDARQMQRFHNEARAAAGLHHEHIAPVHAVGCERAVHYYAMQFIDGRTLAEWIEQQRAPGGVVSKPAADHPSPADDSFGVAAAVTPPPAAVATSSPVRDAASFRRLAEWGMQAAEALEYAHSVGIVHRDIKPANLMVDRQGKLWVTDFGLARTAGDSGLTMTGDLLGTLRYMSPEQALAKHGLVDHRTDVYSLGVTLYELLTLRPAVEGKDREEILQRIAFEEPTAPRSWNNRIPLELETIVLKAMAKEPVERYGTAKELADDLQRWLNNEPIRARRPTLRQRAIKWGLRHKPVMGAGLVVLLMALVLTGYIAWTSHDRALQRAAVAYVVRKALDESESWQQQRRLPEALSAARRADGLLGGADVDEALRKQVQRRRDDLVLLNRLENARLEVMMPAKGKRNVNVEGADALYSQIFREANLDVESLPAEEAAERIRSSTVAVELAAALDAWSLIRQNIRGTNDPGWKALLRIARLADTDARRTRVREALERRDEQELLAAASAPDVFDLPPATLSVLGVTLLSCKGSRGQVEAFLRQAQRRHPNDNLLNINLAEFFCTIVQPPQAEEAYHFGAVAVALRPDSPLAHIHLGVALHRKGCVDEAIAEYKEALRLNKDFALAHGNLGAALREKRQLDEAISEFREAIRINKDDAEAHSDLGTILCDKGRLDEAITELREAIRIKKDYAKAHYNLGNALLRTGQLDEAITAYRQAIRIKKDYAEPHNNLGVALCYKGQLDEAITECREAIHLKKDLPSAHSNLGNVLLYKGQLDEAITAYREAIRLKYDSVEPHCNLGNALRDKGQLDEAIKSYREAIRIKKDFAPAHCNLGNALCDKGRLDEAIAEFREAIRIDKGDPVAHYNLGNTLRDKGRLNEAIAEYREALRLKKDDDFRKSLQQVEQMARLDGSLARILQGKEQPKDAAERLSYAWLCQQNYKKRYAIAARFYSEAFAQEPQLTDDLNAQHRYNAACAGALAGCGQGMDADKLDAKGRAGLRQQALDWLRADLKAYRQLMEKSAGKASPAIAQRMQHWQKDSDFAGVRDGDALSRLPEAERHDWQQLWREVDTLRKRAQSAASPDRKKSAPTKESPTNKP